MWLKLENGNYQLVESGLSLVVGGNKDGRKGFYIAVERENTFPPHSVVQKGYSTREDAQAALDELMDSVDHLTVQPPTKPEELQEEA